MTRVLKVKDLPGYRLELDFDDGVCGVANLSKAVCLRSAVSSELWPCFPDGRPHE